jgi:hypothetical protein
MLFVFAEILQLSSNDLHVGYTRWVRLCVSTRHRVRNLWRRSAIVARLQWHGPMRRLALCISAVLSRLMTILRSFARVTGVECFISCRATYTFISCRATNT